MSSGQSDEEALSEVPPDVDLTIEQIRKALERPDYTEDQTGAAYTSLRAPGRGLTIINSLSTFSALRHVDLGANKLQTLAPLSGCHGLLSLHVAANALKDDAFEGLDLSHLLVLDVSGNARLSDAFLERLRAPDLRALHLNGTSVRHLSLLSGHPRLQQLEARDTEALDLPLGCPQLRSIYAAHSRIIHPWPSLLTDERREALGITEASQPTSDAVLPVLSVLHLRACPLRSLEGLSRVCPALQTLNLRATPLDSFRNLVTLPSPALPPSLTRISLAGSLLVTRQQLYADHLADLESRAEQVPALNPQRPLDLAITIPEPEEPEDQPREDGSEYSEGEHVPPPEPIIREPERPATPDLAEIEDDELRQRLDEARLRVELAIYGAPGMLIDYRAALKALAPGLVQIDKEPAPDTPQVTDVEAAVTQWDTHTPWEQLPRADMLVEGIQFFETTRWRAVFDEFERRQAEKREAREEARRIAEAEAAAAAAEAELYTDSQGEDNEEDEEEPQEQEFEEEEEM